MVAQSSARAWRVTANWHKVSVRGDGNVPKLDCGDSWVTLPIYYRSLICTLPIGVFYGI